MAARLRRMGWLLIVTGVACSATLIFLPGGAVALAAGIACLGISAVVGHLDSGGTGSAAPVTLSARVRGPVQVREGSVGVRARLDD